MTLLSVLAPILNFVAPWDEQRKHQTFVVGGIIRDALIGCASSGAELNVQDLDVDLMTFARAKDLATDLVASFGGEIREFVPFGTAKVSKIKTLKGISEIDVAHCRSEGYPQPGALPVVREGSLDEDVRRRDFTINTLLLPCDAVRRSGEAVLSDPSTLRAVLIDRAGGLADLDSKQIRILHDRSFVDDPTRLFRASRYASRINGRLEEATEKTAQRAVRDGCLKTISVTRQVKELEFVLSENDSVQALGILTKLGVIAALSFSFDASAALSVLRKQRPQKSSLVTAPSDLSSGLLALTKGLPESDRTKVLNTAGVSNKRIQLLVAELQKLG